MDDFDLEIKKEFINEALMNLEEAEGAFMDLEVSSEPKELLDKIFRLAHNLKGGSRAVGFGDVAEFTHKLENLVQAIQKGQVQLSSSIVTVLLRSNDRLIEMLNELKTNLEAKFDNQDLLNEIAQALSGEVQNENIKKESASTVAQVENANAAAQVENTIAEIQTADVVETVSEVKTAEPQLNAAENMPAESMPPQADAFFQGENEVSSVVNVESKVLSSVSTIESNISAAEPKKIKPKENQEVKEKDDEVVRVNLSRIDMLNDYVGELIVLQSVIQQQFLTDQKIGLQASIRQLVKLSKDVQGLSMSLRMLPVKPLIQKLQRVVRDTAKAIHKEVQLEIIGEQIEIDKSVLDRLVDPLIHILRNAVDHGLETPQERLKVGKPSAGKVTLSLANEGNNLRVTVSDDGRGINADFISKKAIEKGLITPTHNLTQQQIIELVFHPGFSTKTEASEISGRGVGMDVVKTNVEKAGGQVDIQTEVGKGSVFTLQIPLSLAVIEGMIVTTGKGRYVIPLSQVHETVNLSSQKVYLNRPGIGSCIELRGTVVPLFDLENLLRGNKHTENNWNRETVMLISVRNRLVGLVVQEIVKSQQIVIKPLGNGITISKGWLGSCVLGDGLPTLILSPVDILEGIISNGSVERINEGVA